MNNRPWMKSDTDKMLDNFLASSSISQLAKVLKRSPQEIKSRLSQFYNDKERAERYFPIRRMSRSGARWTQNETGLRDSLLKQQTSLKTIARVLQRDISEISVNPAKDIATISTSKRVAPTMDLIWAYRYAYFVWGKEEKGLISDKAYDDLVKEEIEFGGGQRIFNEIKSEWGWPSHIKSLALYLSEKGKWKLKE